MVGKALLDQRGLWVWLPTRVPSWSPPCSRVLTDLIPLMFAQSSMCLDAGLGFEPSFILFSSQGRRPGSKGEAEAVPVVLAAKPPVLWPL